MNAPDGTIVVGIDGSEHSERALDWAIAEAKIRGTRLELVAAWHVPPAIYMGPGFTPPIDESVESAFREVAEEVVGKAAGRARAAGVEAETRLEHGQAAEVLVEASADADLLVVGSRGRGGFAGLLLGSVSTQCAHHASCALVIVRPRR
ncbi:MAG TPA: universal stress protein [Gaiellaceae bacterium]|nr:universal stress protein [Gaiellaceae bacterium]